MKQDIKFRWTAALRSGRYKQGKMRLHYVDVNDEHFYCCLGVLCELAVEDGIVKKTKFEDDANFYYNREENYLPDAVCEWAGLKKWPDLHGEFKEGLTGSEKINSGGPVQFRDVITSLPRMNDDAVPFVTIADVIDEQL